MISSDEQRRREQVVVKKEAPDLLRPFRIPELYSGDFGLDDLLLGLAIELFLSL